MAIQFHVNPDYPTVEITGQFIKKEFYKLPMQIQEKINEHSLNKVFIDMDDFDLFSFKDADRYFLVLDFVHVLPKSSKIAVFKSDKKYVNYFGENVTVNRGLIFKIFFEKNNAILWLKE